MIGLESVPGNSKVRRRCSMKGIGRISLLVSVLLLSAAASQALSPPWWMAYNKLCYSVGMTAGVTVEEPSLNSQGNYVVVVVVDTLEVGEEVLEALDALLVDELFSTEIVVVDHLGYQAHGSPGQMLTAADVASLLEVAFEGNIYFDSVDYREFLTTAFLITKPRLVQYCADNLNEANGRETYVVEELFDDCLKDEVGGIPVTCSSAFKPTPGC
jgi:hypothetical protein